MLDNVGCICKGILLSHEKDGGCAICRGMDGPRGWHADCRESEGERQTP